MNKRSLFAVLTLCLAWAVMLSGVAAQNTIGPSTGGEGVQNKRIGTAAATELLIPVGARDMAMGGSGLATSSGIDALHWNPAGFGRLSGSAEASLSTMKYIADINVNYGAVGINFGSFGSVGLSIKALDFGDIPLTTTDDPENVANRTFTPSFVTLGFSYARAFTDAITAGGTFKLISENFHRVSGTGFAVDIGIQYRGVAGFKGVNLGVALKNMGPQVNFGGPALLRLAQASDGRRPTQYYQSNASSWELPTSIEIGVAYERNLNDNLTYSVNGTFANNNLALDGYRGGAEVAYKMDKLRLAGRGGIELSDKGELDEQIFGPTAGFGFTYYSTGLDITVDYAYRSVDFFESNNMFSLKLGF